MLQTLENFTKIQSSREFFHTNFENFSEQLFPGCNLFFLQKGSKKHVQNFVKTFVVFMLKIMSLTGTPHRHHERPQS